MTSSSRDEDALRGYAQPSGDGAAADDRPLRLTYLVKKLELALRAEIDRELRPLDVTGPQYNALAVLRLNADISSAQLGRKNRVSAQAANEVVASLERKDLVERRPDPRNRRVLRMRLTMRGESVLGECLARVEPIGARMVAQLSEVEQEAMEVALQRCISALVDP